MSESLELDVRRVRAAKNQSLFREVNERIGELSVSSPASFIQFVCECMTEGCDQQVSLTREEYEQIRSGSNRFFVVTGHEVVDVERIVDSTDRYVVVANLGKGESVAEHLDPRKRASR